MFRKLRNLPSLERKFVYLLLASVLVFVVYLIFNFTSEVPSTASIKVQYRLLNQLTTIKTELQEPVVVENGQKSGLFSNPSPPLNPVPVSVGHNQNSVNVHQRFRVPSVHTQKFTGPENARQVAIVDAFKHAWNAYKTYAWGHDELKPLSKSYHNWMSVGLTIVDSMDTLIIMGLNQEFALARKWVSESLTFEHNGEVQLFEMTIRVLGGLLSAFHLSGDKVFLDKAKELGDKFAPCFRGVTKIPCNRINLKRQEVSFIEISTAESGSIQLEFTDLSRSTNDSTYEVEAAAVSWHLHGLEKLDGLAPCFINPFSGTFHKTTSVSVGASCDSYYEYLLKQWIQTGKTKDWLKNDYLVAVEGIKKHLLRRSQPGGLAFVGSLSNMSPRASFKNEMEHLSCFLPGTLALGVLHGLDSSHLQLADDLVTSCYKMYESMPTGLSPEIAIFSTDANAVKDITAPYHSQYNIHRPETVESLFYLYRATGNQKYREYAWNIFQAFEKYTRLPEGYASIDNVQKPRDVKYKDKMESFYLAETLKYLYLLFSDNAHLLPLDRYVMNTEAHPLPIYTS